MNVLVVPTNRPDQLPAFLAAWQPWPWDRILIVEDGPSLSAVADDARVLHYCWRDIDAAVDRPEIFSRGDSAIRAFGFWKAWTLGADVIFTLDDDCYPSGDGFVATHLSNLRETPVWQSTVPHLRVRGLPYVNAGTLGNVRVSVGLWIGHPDVDAVQALAGPRAGDVVLARGLASRVMPADQFFPLCGMNLAFHRDVACLLFCPRMGAGSPYARFDDIWAGVVLQRICRHLRLAIVCGAPVVDHRRASDPFANLVKEAPGIRANENVWPLIDAIELHGTEPLACMREVGRALCQSARGDDYIRRWGADILNWCALFDPRADGRPA